MDYHIDVKNCQQLQDYAHSRYFIKLKPGQKYAHLFLTEAWAYHRGKLSENDLIRVRDHEGTWDVTITVVAVKPDGVVMRRWPIEPSQADLDEAREIGKADRFVHFSNDDGKPVVRVEHTSASGWRVLGLHGEVSRDHKTEAEATAAMKKYLADIKYAMPDAEVQAEELRKHQARMKAAEEAAKLKREARRLVRGG